MWLVALLLCISGITEASDGNNQKVVDAKEEEEDVVDDDRLRLFNDSRAAGKIAIQVHCVVLSLAETGDHYPILTRVLAGWLVSKLAAWMADCLERSLLGKYVCARIVI